MINCIFDTYENVCNEEEPICVKNWNGPIPKVGDRLFIQNRYNNFNKHLVEILDVWDHIKIDDLDIDEYYIEIKFIDETLFKITTK